MKRLLVAAGMMTTAAIPALALSPQERLDVAHTINDHYATCTKWVETTRKDCVVNATTRDSLVWRLRSRRRTSVSPPQIWRTP
jgi:hypothetical protein